MTTPTRPKKKYQLYLTTKLVNSIDIFSHHLRVKHSHLVETAVSKYLEEMLLEHNQQKSPDPRVAAAVHELRQTDYPVNPRLEELVRLPEYPTDIVDVENRQLTTTTERDILAGVAPKERKH